MRQTISALLLLGVLTAIGATPGAQGPARPQVTPEPGTGLVLGRVVDAVSGAGVPGVVLILSVDPPAFDVNDPTAGQRAALSDAQGRFLFQGLSRSTYTISTSMGGSGFTQSGFIIDSSPIAPYLDGGFGQERPGGPLAPIDLTDGQRVTDLVVRVWPGAAIEGTVTDETGEPLVNTAVAAARRGGNGQLQNGPSTRTDDRGMYRLGTLEPGDYVVVVPQMQTLLPSEILDEASSSTGSPLSGRLTSAGSPFPNFTGPRVGGAVFSTNVPTAGNGSVPIAHPSSRPAVYQTTFYPAATNAARASAVRVRAGETRQGINVRLTPVATSTVSGTLLDGGTPVPSFGVHLMPADTGDGAAFLEVAATATDARGTFVFPLVPPGDYRIVAVRNTLSGRGRGVGAAPAPTGVPSTIAEQRGAWAVQSVTVADRNVANLAVTLSSGLTFGGRVEFQGTGARPTESQLRPLSIGLESEQPLFRDSRVRGRPASRVDPSGTFLIEGLLPGRYTINRMVEILPIMLPGWSVQSIQVQGRDVTGRVMTIEKNIADALVTLTDRPASLAGTITPMSGAASASAFLFPADRAVWPEAGSDPLIFQTVRASKQGTFKFGRVVPGDYIAAAALEAAASTWPAPDFLATLAASGTRIRIEPGGTASVALRIRTP